MIRTTTLLFCLLWSFGLSAQIAMRDVLRTMPDSVVPYLTENNRLDMIDFVESNMESVVTNALGGKSQMQQLTDQYLSIQLNESSTIAMRLLDVPAPVDSLNQILCVVRTYGSDIRESTVAFYSLAWRPLPQASYFSQPAEMFTATLAADEPTLTLRQETPIDTLLEEQKQETKEVLTILKWNNGFVKEN